MLLYGRKATSAVLTMDGKPEQLSYRSVMLTFTSADLQVFGDRLAQDVRQRRQPHWKIGKRYASERDPNTYRQAMLGYLHPARWAAVARIGVA